MRELKNKHLNHKYLKTPYLIAVTGNFGVGKNLIGSILQSKGIAVIDTDDIVASLLASKNPTTEKIAHVFGKAVAGDKKALAKIVFNNKLKRKTLESIIHPQVRDRLRQFVKKNKKMIIVLIPLLFESGMEKNYHEVWCVICSKDVQLKRLIKKGFTLDEIELRLNSQMKQAIKARKADFVIDNSRSIRDSKKQVLKRLKVLAQLTHSPHLFLSK